MRDRDIIIVSTQDFDDLWTRKQRWARRLASGNRVLYVESQMHWVTLLRTWPRHRTRLSRQHRALREVSTNLWVWTPPVLWPFFQMWRPINRFNNRRMARHLQRLAQHLGFSDVLLWLYTPYSSDLITALGPAMTVYESVDDFSAARGLIRSAVVRELEDDTFRRADLTIVTAEPLAELAKRQTPRWRLSPNACDVEFFAGAADSGKETHHAVRGLSGPVFGFVGAVAYWVDCDLLAHLARTCPDATVVVVGPIRVDITPYRGIPNLIFTGGLPYPQMPDVLRGFDVCLNPYKTDEFARGASPLKLYEYLATGKPVVSTPMPEAERFGEVVRITGTRDDFVAACKAAARETDDEREQRESRQTELIAPHTWEARFREIESWVDGLIVSPRWTHSRPPKRGNKTRTRARHVVINALSITGPELAGGFTYFTSLMRHLVSQNPDVHFTVVGLRSAGRYLSDAQSNLSVAAKSNVLRFGPLRSLYERYFMTALLKRLRANVYFTPYGFLPRQRVCPQVITFQNLYYFHAHEYAHLQSPHRWARWYERIRLKVFRRRLHEDTNAADSIIAVSRTAAEELIANLHVPAEKVHAVHEGVGFPFVADCDTAADTVARLGCDVRTEYFLSVGAIAPNKNLSLLLAAYAEFVQESSNAPDLILAGADWRSFSRHIKAEAMRLGVTRQVRFLGHVDAGTLAALYRGAVATIQLSECESFGLPALEAMACGSPLVAANRSGMSEVGGRGAIQVDPHDTGAIADVLDRLSCDNAWRDAWVGKGRKRAGDFSWRKAAAQSYAVIAEAAGWKSNADVELPVVNRIGAELFVQSPAEAEA